MPDITATRPSSGAPIETTWGAAVHDQLEGLQGGMVNVTLTGQNANTAPVVFPRAYTAPPVVVVTVNVGSGTLFAIEDGVSATGFNARLVRKDEATTTVTAQVHWIALGTPA